MFWFPVGALALAALVAGSAWTGGRVYQWELTAWGLIAGCFAGGCLMRDRSNRELRESNRMLRASNRILLGALEDPPAGCRPDAGTESKDQEAGRDRLRRRPAAG
jgi:hypothetical protein